MAENTFGILRKVVGEARAFPGWSFRLQDEGGDLRLIITIDGHDNYNPERPMLVGHYHPVPVATYNEATWRRWVFDRCRGTLNHELGEILHFNGVRPFAPMHGPGEDPYTCHEIRPEVDALTTQNGDIRPGPV